MAATAANTERLGIGGPGGIWLYSEITLDSSYAAGGESITAATFGLKYFKAVWLSRSEDGLILDYTLSSDKTSMTIRVWSPANVTTSVSVWAVDMSAGKDLSAVVIPVLIRGI